MQPHWQTFGKYSVEVDGVTTELDCQSLAEVANKIRGTGKHIKVWSPAGLLLIDTAFGDTYNLIS